MGFIRLKVRTRIYLGFAALVVLSIGIAGFGIYQFSGVGTNVGKMDRLANVSQRILITARNLEAIRRAETRYLVDAQEASMKDARDNAERANAQIAEALRVSVTPERANIYRSVLDTLRAQGAHLDQLAKLSATWVAERAKLFTGGDALTSATNKLVTAARSSGDAAVGDAAYTLERTVLLVRVANWRFIATEEKAGVATFRTNSENANAAVVALQHNASADVAPLIAPVQSALAAYEAAFTAYSTAKLSVEALYSEQMRPQILAMQGQLDTAAASVAKDFDASRTTVVDTVSSASLLQEILAVVALVIGVGLAFLIGRSIVGPLTSMTGVMGKLAAGDNTIDIPARDNTDEIGDMARAVEVFKEHAIEAERLAAEQETARVAKERRQAAMEQHTQEFGSSISGVMASLAGSADGMRRAAEAMSEAVTAVHTEANGTAGSAAKSSQDLMAVAAAVEQLTSSVAEIARQLAAASEVSQQAVQRAESSHATMQGLSEATARIGDVVHLINDIASQTNLLASFLRFIKKYQTVSVGLIRFYPCNTHDSTTLAWDSWGQGRGRSSGFPLGRRSAALSYCRLSLMRRFAAAMGGGRAGRGGSSECGAALHAQI